MARPRRANLSGWMFIAFPLAVIVTFTALPTLAGVVLSFFQWDGGGVPRFIGLENYRAAVGEDPQFWYALRNTLIFTAVTVPITTVIAYLFAVAINARWFLGRTLTRTLFFLPTVISIVAIGFIWRWVLDPQSGLLNGGLRLVNADALFDGDLPPWLGDSPWSLAAIIVIQVWRHLGFCVVLYLAALGRVPRSLYEAAGVDGADSWKMIWRIGFPAVRPTTMFLLITGTIWALQVFDLVWVITGGAEQRWTDVINAYLYREFSANRLGYAATVGVFILLITAVITAVQFRLLDPRREATA